MTRILLSVTLACIGLLGSDPARAQAVTAQLEPAQPAAGQPVTLVLSINTPDCLLFAHSPVERLGQEVRVSYTLDPTGGICGVPPPTTRRGISLGVFPPGSYTVTASGSFVPSGVPLATVSRGFVVVDTAANIPANAPWALVLLAGIALLAASRTLPRH